MGTLNQILIPPPSLNLMSGATGFCIASSESNSMLYHTLCFISARYRTTIYQLEPNFAVEAHLQQRNSQAKDVRLRQPLLELESISSTNTASPSWYVTIFVSAHLLPYTCTDSEAAHTLSSKEDFYPSLLSQPGQPLVCHHESEKKMQPL